MTVWQPTTLVDMLRERAAATPDVQAFTYLRDGQVEAQSLTYAALDREARGLAARLQQLAARGERAILLYGPGLDPIPAVFGCLYAGLIVVPVTPPMPNVPPTALLAVLRDAQTDLVLTTQGFYQRAQQLFGATDFFKALRWVVTDSPENESAASEWQAAEPAPADIAILLYTSGSTTTPRGVMLSHANLLAHLRAVHTLFTPAPGSRMVTWLPLYHGGGLMGSVFHPMFGDIQTFILSPLDVMQQPLNWLRAISHYQAAISGGPNFAYQMGVEHIPPEARAGLDLSHWQFAHCGGETIRAETLQAFAAAYAQHGFDARAFVPVYGLAEATLLVTAHRPGTPLAYQAFDRNALALGQVRPAGPEGQVLVGCGQSFAGVSVRIVDPAARQVSAPGAIGEIWVTGECVAEGYWQRPEATEAVFGAFLAGGEGPFLRTGDLGFQHDGELYITGRVKDLIIIRGRNYYAQDIEAAAAHSHPALAGGAAAFSVPAASGEQVVIYHEVRPAQTAPDVEEISRAVRRAVGDTLQVPVHAVVLVEAGALPRTPTGKIQRYRCREEFLQAYPPEGAAQPN